MRTFEKYTHCLFPNKELYWQAFQYAKSKGVPVWDGQKDSYSAFVVSFLFNEYPVIYLDEESLCGLPEDHSCPKEKEITIAQFFEYCDNWQKLKPVELQLTSDYKAVINKDDKTVKVGCQTIPFDKINELHKLINAQ